MNNSPGRALIGAAALFAVALFVFGSAVVRAFSYSPPVAPAPAPEPARQEAADPEGARQALTMEALMLAIDNDPFTPQRTRSAERYRLPGDVDPEPPPPPPPPAPVPDFRLSGTVVTSDGGLALVHVGDSPPRMLAMGDLLEGYRLAAVSEQGAVMANSERQLQLRVPSPPRVAQSAQPARGQGARAGPQGRAAMDPRTMQQIVERARAAGASPQMIESLMRMMQERGISAIDQLEIGPNGFSFRSGNTNVRTSTSSPPPPPPSPPPGPEQRRMRARPDTMELRSPRAPL